MNNEELIKLIKEKLIEGFHNLGYLNFWISGVYIEGSELIVSLSDGYETYRLSEEILDDKFLTYNNILSSSYDIAAKIEDKKWRI